MNTSAAFTSRLTDESGRPTFAALAAIDSPDLRFSVKRRAWIPRPRYGDKLQVGGDPGNPIKHVVGVLDLEQLTDAELDPLERFTEARLAAQDVKDRGD